MLCFPYIFFMMKVSKFMMKKIAVVNDLSSFGRCSLVAAISVLSAMGVQACPLPTAILSAQTGYPDYFCEDYTSRIKHFSSHWQKMQQHFDGIYIGFMTGEAQFDAIFSFLDRFHSPSTFLLVDPVMGDDGKLYPIFTPKLLKQMKQLALRAQILTPNLTEFCLLTDLDYQRVIECSRLEEKLKLITDSGAKLCQKGPQQVIITGISNIGSDGHPYVGNLHIVGSESHFYNFPLRGCSYSGTGDLFASAIAAGFSRGIPAETLIPQIGRFLLASLEDAIQQKIPQNDGVYYEAHLSMLTPERLK